MNTKNLQLFLILPLGVITNSTSEVLTITINSTRRTYRHIISSPTYTINSTRRTYRQVLPHILYFQLYYINPGGF